VLAQLICRTDGFALRAVRSVSVILLLSLYGKLTSVILLDRTFSKPGDVVGQAYLLERIMWACFAVDWS
jgi:ethanolamine transporter EutH